MAFPAPVRSIRVRLQIWYALVLVAVIGGFAGVLYFQARHALMRETDSRLSAAAGTLKSTLMSQPPHEMDGGWPLGDGLSPPDRPRLDRGGPDPRRAGPPPPRPGELPPEERLQMALAMSAEPGGGRRERLSFTVWRRDGTMLATNEPPTRQRPGFDGPQPAEGDRLRPEPPQGEAPGGFRWVGPNRRELLTAGPRGTLLLVGQPIGRELGALAAFAWQLVGSGLLVMVLGLAGGWLISRSITEPIARISRTASEISASNLSRRIDVAGIDAELVGLASILNDMFARLEAAFERQSQFTSDASHELRTPLAVIHAHAELALSRPRSAEEYQETLAACLKAAGRMGNLVDGLLMLARADAGRLDTRFARVDLQAIVQEVVEQYRPQAAAVQVELAATCGEPLRVEGEAALLARICSNLVSNALRYTPAGGTVDVSLQAEAQSALLVVEDSGCGIPLEDQAQVFERFFRADKARSRAQGGNGLGLAICKSLVEVHRGSISFKSAPQRGTRFEVRLPLAGGPEVARLVAPVEAPPSLDA